MSDNFVRKDLHDANMAEIRALMAASLEVAHTSLARILQTPNDRKFGLRLII